VVPPKEPEHGYYPFQHSDT